MERTSGRIGSLNGRSVLVGSLGILGMAAFYVVVVAWASGSWQHLAEQLRSDWYLVVAVLAGFGIQVMLLAELRHRRRLAMATAAAGGTGAGASAAGMVACCAHHIADLLPFLGAGGAATFLYDYRVAFVAFGVGINGAGAGAAARRLRRVPTVPTPARESEEETETCAVA